MEIEYEVAYQKWGKLVAKAQLIIAIGVLITEIVNNTLLYVTRSQGYGPDTIVQKLLRYLVLTSATNFFFAILSLIVERKCKDELNKRYLLMLFMVIMCTNVAFSHYQFSVTFAIFVIPLVISILYEDWGLMIFTFIISLIGQIIGIWARAVDKGYNKDIGPEAAISFALTSSVMIFAKLIHQTLVDRREDVKEAVVQVEKANATAEKMTLSLKMLETLASTLDAKDKYTNGHSLRVAIYSTKLAEAIGWEEQKIEELRYEALLHDIGKIGVPDVVLNKPSRLTDTEFGLIKSHTLVGADILKNMIAVPNASEVAKFHHERYDGHGYPTSLAGEDIPLNARIVCIADSYDAMSSDRIYRKALPNEVIREELVKGRGSQFDPELLDVFLKLFDDEQLKIKTEEYSLYETDAEQQYLMDDIELVLNRVANMGENLASIKEFDKFYKYMRNIGLRYNRSIEVITVDLETVDAQKYENENDVSDKLQKAIRKNIRAVDVYYRYSATKHMVVLLDAGMDNVEMIQQRISFDFDQSGDVDGWSLKYTVSEDVSAMQE